MNSGRISMRYARSLFEYTLENGIEDTLFVEMKQLSESFSSETNFRATLDNPVLNVKDKLALIETAAGGNISDAFKRFTQLVLHQRRENHLQTISLLYLDLYRQHKNITVAKLITASQVDKVTKDKIKQLVQKEKEGDIEFITQIDPSITGGFILYLDTYRIDASVSTQLKQIKYQLLNENKKIA